MCYPICGMVHIKEPLLLIGKSSLCSDGSGFPLLLFACVECVIKENISFLPSDGHFVLLSEDLLTTLSPESHTCRWLCCCFGVVPS